MEARRKSQGVSGFCRPPCLLRPRAELKLILLDGSTVPLRRREGLDWVDLLGAKDLPHAYTGLPMPTESNAVMQHRSFAKRYEEA